MLEGRFHSFLSGVWRGGGGDGRGGGGGGALECLGREEKGARFVRSFAIEVDVLVSDISVLR